MFRECKLAGVASAIRGDYKVNLHAPIFPNLAWLKELRTKGAEFCGMSDADQSYCQVSISKPVLNPGLDSNGKPIYPCAEKAAPTPNGNGANSSSNAPQPVNPNSTPIPSPPAGNSPDNLEVTLNNDLFAAIIGEANDEGRYRVVLSAGQGIKQAWICDSEDLVLCAKRSEKVNQILSTVLTQGHNKDRSYAKTVEDISIENLSFVIEGLDGKLSGTTLLGRKKETGVSHD